MSDETARQVGSREIKVFFASPDDLREEREEFPLVLDSLNEERSEFRFAPLRWEDLPSQYGQRPQDVINGLIDQADVFILSLHRRWGRKASDSGFGSYTEEEFERARASFLHNERPVIFVLFKTVDEILLEDPGTQLKKVMKFKSDLSKGNKVLWREYSDLKQFKEELARHLIEYGSGELPLANTPRSLPKAVLDELAKGKNIMTQAKEELEGTLEFVDKIQGLLGNLDKHLAFEAGISSVEDLGGSGHTEAEIRQEIDEKYELAKKCISEAVTLAKVPEMAGAMKMLEAILHMLPPRPPGFDPQTYSNMKLMCEAFEELMELVPDGVMDKHRIERRRLTFETSLHYEKAKLGSQKHSDGTD